VGRALAALVLVLAGGFAGAQDEGALVRYRIVGDGVPVPLTESAGEAARGRRIVTSRDFNCVLCHVVPDGDAQFAGNVGPSLAGVGRRLSASQLRLRVVDQTRINPDTVMPPYYRVQGLNRVAQGYRGKPVLGAQDVEDVVAYLSTLK
jgi:sulfur-oxidizing protein SoxX